MIQYILLAAALVLAGCQTAPPTVFVRELPVRVATSNQLDVIRFPSTYRSYTIGRRADPRNPTVMHESHILYVRETPDRWNLQPPAAASSALPLTPPADPTFSPLPVAEQLRQELLKQQRISQDMTDQNGRVQKSADVLLPAANKVAEISSQMNQRQQLIEERLRRQEQNQRAVAPTNWPAFGSTNR